jgi:hypothetical protein
MEDPEQEEREPGVRLLRLAADEPLSAKVVSGDVRANLERLEHSTAVI